MNKATDAIRRVPITPALSYLMLTATHGRGEETEEIK